jgi:hypothetical protein
MMKFEKYLKMVLFLCIFSTIGSMAYGQAKTGKEPAKPANKSTKAASDASLQSPASTPQGMPAMVDEKEKSKFAGMKFNFVVFVNPANPQAIRQWAIMPEVVPGFTAEPIFENTYLVTGQGEEYALFQKAFGSQFQIFTFDELTLYGQSLPFFIELKDRAEQLSAKLKK